MSRNLLIFGLILFIIAGMAFFAFSNSQSRNKSKTVDIHGHTIKIEIADTQDKQIKGLSQRNSLAEDSGMLFVFPEPGTYQFWMKDMRFPIDIIFISSDKVITIYNNVQPYTGTDKSPNLTLYSPIAPVDRVLEINAGLADKYGLKEGDTIVINK